MFEEQIDEFKKEIDNLVNNPKFKQIIDIMDFREHFWKTNKEFPDNLKESMVSLFEKNIIIAFYNKTDDVFELKLNFYNPILLGLMETDEFKVIFETVLSFFFDLGDN